MTNHGFLVPILSEPKVKGKRGRPAAVTMNCKSCYRHCDLVLGPDLTGTRSYGLDIRQ